jgi:hypothetical protein
MMNFIFGQRKNADTSVNVSTDQTERQTSTTGLEDQCKDAHSDLTAQEQLDKLANTHEDGTDTTRDSSSETNIRQVFCHWHGDCSGSMYTMGNAGYKEGKNFCSEWRTFGKSNPQIKTEISFYTFSAEGNLVFRGDASRLTDTDIEKCGIAMTPDSTTCLYDTAVEQAKCFLANINAAYNDIPEDENKSKNIKDHISSTFMLMTDGIDNMSNKYNGADLRKIFEELKKIGTTVCFAAANMDAINVGKDYGLDRNACLQMGSDHSSGGSGLRAMTDAAIRTATRSRDSNDESCEIFTQAERLQSCEPTLNRN